MSALLNLGLRTAVGTLLPANDQAEASSASPQRDKLPPTLHAFITPISVQPGARANLRVEPIQRRCYRVKHQRWQTQAKRKRARSRKGQLSDLRRIPEPLRSGITAHLAGEQGARTWTSATPFVLPRHAKRRGANTLEGQILAELTSRDLPPAQVLVLPWDSRTLKLRHAVRVRRHPARIPASDAGYAIRLVFEQPVVGPISLGYAAHFGLGLFIAETP